MTHVRRPSDRDEGLQVIENMVVRDGVEPPTPAFSAVLISDRKYIEVAPGATSH
jgi:hypothetical protein